MNPNAKIILDADYGYLRIEPIPSQEEVEKYYLEEFYSANAKRFNDSSFEVQKEERDFFNSRWESIYNVCTQHFNKKTDFSVFDIGFGFAQALLYFKERGLRTCGLEPSREGFEFAKSQGLQVYQSGIEDFSCAGDERFDVVTLLNVLEHLRNPAATLKAIKNALLKSNGLLVIDVPNEFNDFQTTANKEYNLNEWWVAPPNHINYFSATSLKSLLNKCGYDIVHCESSFPLEMFLLFGDVYVRDPKLGKECHSKRVRFEYLMRKHGKDDKLAKLYKSLADLDLGRQVVAFATPQ